MPNEHIFCPSCQRPYPHRSGLIGRRVRCPECEAIFRVEPVSDDIPRKWEQQLAKPPMVFVSHSQQDRNFVERHVRPFFQEHGLHVWSCETSIEAGKPWEEAI